MATAAKITKANFRPSNTEVFPVYAQRFNELVDVVNELEPTDGNLTVTSVTSSSATGEIGFTTGAGGAVTQTNNRTTGVTLSKPCGIITTNATSLAGGAEATFTVTNTLVEVGDVIIANIATMTTGVPVVNVTDVSAGSFDLTVSNLSGTTADTSADVINFVLIKGVGA